MLFTSQFTLSEMLSLLGLIQSVYVLVYLLLRSGRILTAVAPFLYFLSIGAAFFMDAAMARWSPYVHHYELWSWLFWFSGIPLGTILIFQVAQMTEPLRLKHFALLLLIPLALLPAWGMEEAGSGMVYVAGLIVGALNLLAVWLRRDLLAGLRNNPRFGEERFWLIISLIVLNAAFLGSVLAYVSGAIDLAQWIVIRTILGIAFVYIAATSLFRIYPQAIPMIRRSADPAQSPIKEEDHRVLEKLKTLLEQDKIYQEATYGRAELARELQVGEAYLSRIVNLHYNKTIPQLLNDLRVGDAQRLLKETDVSIQTVFEESGFNSITTFNRVFKELTGESPKEYRIRFRL